MKILYSILIIILIFTITSCTSSTDNANDPKVQGSRMLEKGLKKAQKDALAAANQLMRENKDFILVSNGELCIFEKKESKVKKVEIGVPIEERFTGEYTKNKEYYASRLPIGTKVYIVTKDKTLYRFAEVSNDIDKIYKCKNFMFVQRTN